MVRRTTALLLVALAAAAGSTHGETHGDPDLGPFSVVFPTDEEVQQETRRVNGERAAWVSEPVTVFEKGERCFRIPTMLQTAKGTIVVFAENRTKGCGDTDGTHTLVARRSVTGGRTWQDPITVFTPSEMPCPTCPMAPSNPNPVEVAFADGSRAILLHFDTMNNPKADAHGSDCQLWSYDDGLTWSSESTLDFPPVTNNGGLIGPSVGVLLDGSIYFSTRFDGATNVYYSEDLGQSWTGVADSITGVDECSIAPKGKDLLMNCRTGEHQRAQIVWQSGKRPQAVTYPEGLIDPNCQGSIVAREGRFYLSNNNSSKSREHMTVKSSNDDGATWDYGLRVWSNPSAYSQLAPLRSGRLGLVFENGFSSTYERISFVTLRGLAENDDEETSEPPFPESLNHAAALLSSVSATE